MGLLHPDNREYAATQGPPVVSGAMPAQPQPVAGNHFGGNRHTAGFAGGGAPMSAAAGVSAGTHIPATQTTATGPAPNTAGPHKYDILNKLDPSVDSDLSKTAAGGVNRVGGAGGVSAANHHQQHHHGVSPALAAGVGAGAGAGMAHHHNHHGANAAYNNNNGGGGLMGGHHHHHQQPVPVTNASMASGPAPNTAGPHRSDLANRLDPTVDSHTGLRK